MSTIENAYLVRHPWRQGMSGAEAQAWRVSVNAAERERKAAEKCQQLERQRFTARKDRNFRIALYILGLPFLAILWLLLPPLFQGLPPFAVALIVLAPWVIAASLNHRH